MLFPEYLTCEDKSAQIARHVVGWLTNRQAREALVARLARLKAQVAHGGASARAAEYILEHLPRATSVIPPPHFLLGLGARDEGRAARRAAG